MRKLMVVAACVLAPSVAVGQSIPADFDTNASRYAEEFGRCVGVFEVGAATMAQHGRSTEEAYLLSVAEHSYLSAIYAVRQNPVITEDEASKVVDSFADAEATRQLQLAKSNAPDQPLMARCTELRPLMRVIVENIHSAK